MIEKRKKVVIQSISACPIWPTEAAEKIGHMLGEINQANTIMSRNATTAWHNAVKGGYAAETFHAESFNLDAILKDKDVRAFTDQFANTPLAPRDQSQDIVVMKDGEQALGIQLKYYKDAEATQKALRATNDGVHQYEKCDVFVGPSDQIDGIAASAEKTALKNQETRPEVSRAAEKVRDSTAGHFEVDGVQSTELGKHESEQLGAGTTAGKELHENMQTGYLDKATIQQSARAAGTAAVITAVTAGCINSFQCIRQVRNGEISTEEAVQRILKETVLAAGDSALKAGVATATVSVSASHLPALFAGSTFRSSLATGTIAGAAVCAVDAVQCLVFFAAGKMSREELETRTGKNVFQTGAAAVGASIGASIGALGGPAGAVIGSLAGGMITSLAMSIALDNHIDKNFMLTLSSTRQVVGAAYTAHESLKYLHLSQEYYACFQNQLCSSENHFAQQVRTMQAQSSRLKNKLHKTVR